MVTLTDLAWGAVIAGVLSAAVVVALLLPVQHHAEDDLGDVSESKEGCSGE